MTLAFATLLARCRMEPARDFTPPRPELTPAMWRERLELSRRRVDTVVLQVDATVSQINGLAWLMERRDGGILARLSELQAEAAERKWGVMEVARARLALLRPRRAEINALGQAYLASVLPGAADAAHRMRRAGISVAVASEVAAEALFGVANALGVSARDIRAPHLRFDALGAYVGCDIGLPHLLVERDVDELLMSTGGARTLYIGTRHSELLAPRDRDSFIAFTGVVARESMRSDGDSVQSFGQLAELLGV